MDVNQTQQNLPPLPPYEPQSTVPAYAPYAPFDRERSTSTMDLDFVVSPVDRNTSAPNEFSMDDLEVAKALTGMRGSDPRPRHETSTFDQPCDATSRTNSSMTFVPKSAYEHHTQTASQQQPQQQQQQQPEPLLALITSQHPLVATAINGSLSAYSSSKSYSTRFRQGAEFVERNIASPVVNTVGAAGRVSGVETGVRWWLGRNGSTSSPSSTPTAKNNKRRRESNDMDLESGPSDAPLPYRSRAASDLSQSETLPAYDDDRRSPVYSEQPLVLSQQQQQRQQRQQRQQSSQDASPAVRNWQTRLMISTSGLGVAMSDESLRSLKYCLSWLRWANNHLSNLLVLLQDALKEWDERASGGAGDSDTDSAMDLSSDGMGSSNPQTTSDGGRGGPNDGRSRSNDRAAIAARLQRLKAECMKTLRDSLHVVSRYTGGALPENAGQLVRRHLNSLPVRFRLAATEASMEECRITGAPTPPATADEERGQAAALGQRNRQQPEAVSGARRVVVLAREGLDIMGQVSGVVNGTIVSAEDWCERLGRKSRDGGREGEGSMDGVVVQGEVKGQDSTAVGGVTRPSDAMGEKTQHPLADLRIATPDAKMG